MGEGVAAVGAVDELEALADAADDLDIAIVLLSRWLDYRDA